MAPGLLEVFGDRRPPAVGRPPPRPISVPPTPSEALARSAADHPFRPGEVWNKLGGIEIEIVEVAPDGGVVWKYVNQPGRSFGPWWPDLDDIRHWKRVGTAPPGAPPPATKGPEKPVKPTSTPRPPEFWKKYTHGAPVGEKPVPRGYFGKESRRRAAPPLGEVFRGLVEGPAGELDDAGIYELDGLTHDEADYLYGQGFEDVEIPGFVDVDGPLLYHPDHWVYTADFGWRAKTDAARRWGGVGKPKKKLIKFGKFHESTGSTAADFGEKMFPDDPLFVTPEQKKELLDAGFVTTGQVLYHPDHWEMNRTSGRFTRRHGAPEKKKKKLVKFGETAGSTKKFDVAGIYDSGEISDEMENELLDAGFEGLAPDDVAGGDVEVFYHPDHWVRDDDDPDMFFDLLAHKGLKHKTAAAKKWYEDEFGDPMKVRKKKLIKFGEGKMGNGVRLVDVFAVREAREPTYVLQAKGSAQAPVELVASVEAGDPFHGPMGHAGVEEHPHLFKALGALFAGGTIDRRTGAEVNGMWGKIDHARQGIEVRAGARPRVVPKVKGAERRAT